MTALSISLDQVSWDYRSGRTTNYLTYLFNKVIQGTADVGKKLTEDEVQKAIEYCTSELLTFTSV